MLWKADRVRRALLVAVPQPSGRGGGRAVVVGAAVGAAGDGSAVALRVMVQFHRRTRMRWQKVPKGQQASEHIIPAAAAGMMWCTCSPGRVSVAAPMSRGRLIEAAGGGRVPVRGTEARRVRAGPDPGQRRPRRASAISTPGRRPLARLAFSPVRPAATRGVFGGC